MKPNYNNAGYEMVMYETYNCDAGSDYHIVLMRSKKTGNYVTWGCTDADNFYWGHYFTSFVSAKLDYHERLAQEYRRRIEGNR